MMTPDQVKAEIRKLEENSYCHQPLPKINSSMANRGEGEFTRERKRNTSMPGTK